MANVYDLFSQGVALWNQYQQSKPALNVELWDIDLSESDFSGLNLSSARLPLFVAINTNLSGADFSKADLTGALLRGANLSHANLSGANLWEADLSKANLSGANLREADLSRAQLRGAILDDGIHGDALFSEPIPRDVWNEEVR